MKVLVCDDLEDRCKEAAKAVENAHQIDIEVISLFGDSLKSQLEMLFGNVAVYLNESGADQGPKKTAFDEADLVVIDNNLAHLQNLGPRLTAESIAGYVRAFSTVPYVVSLNKNPDVDFDLRFLVGDYATRADLAINDRHLQNSGLWTGKPSEEFRPWYWPALSTIPDRRRAQVAFVRERLDAPVLGALGFSDDVVAFLSLHARGALSPGATSDGAPDSNDFSISELTFQNVFVESNRTLPDKRDREKLREYANAGNAEIRDVISRIVAADIDLWFRRDVLGPQEALVDLPHLLTRMPFLLGERAANTVDWNEAIAIAAPPFGIDGQLFDNHIKATMFQHDVWVPSPSFWWPVLKADDKLTELFFARGQEWPDIVFCEDRSTFLERTPDGGSPPAEFAAEFEGSWSHRFVSRIANIRYAPRSRFAV
jgi:hypothetical protein